MREQIRDAVEVVYKDGPLTRRIRGVQIVTSDPVFIKLIRADGSILQFNRSVVERIEELRS